MATRRALELVENLLWRAVQELGRSSRLPTWRMSLCGLTLIERRQPRGVINLAKVVPAVGGGVGAGVNVGALKGIYTYSNRLFRRCLPVGSP